MVGVAADFFLKLHIFCCYKRFFCYTKFYILNTATKHPSTCVQKTETEKMKRKLITKLKLRMESFMCIKLPPKITFFLYFWKACVYRQRVIQMSYNTWNQLSLKTNWKKISSYSTVFSKFAKSHMGTSERREKITHTSHKINAFGINIDDCGFWLSMYCLLLAYFFLYLFFIS